MIAYSNRQIESDFLGYSIFKKSIILRSRHWLEHCHSELFKLSLAKKKDYLPDTLTEIVFAHGFTLIFTDFLLIFLYFPCFSVSVRVQNLNCQVARKKINS